MSPLTESQRTAIEARGNVIVVAGAGTGKTSTLVERCLALLQSGCSLENILMVTFTDAAAAEMRSRIREALRHAAQNPDAHGVQATSAPPTGKSRDAEDFLLSPRGTSGERTEERGNPGQPASSPRPSPPSDGGEGEVLARPHSEMRLQATSLREHLERQLALLDAANISTLHSFCLRLVREHFYELEIDPDVTVLDEQQTQPLIRQTLDCIFERHFAGESEPARAVQSLVRLQGRGAEENIRALVLKLHRFLQSLANPESWRGEQLARFRNLEPVHWREWIVEGFLDWRLRWRPVLEPFTEIPAVGLSLAALNHAPDQCSVDDAACSVRTIQAADRSADNWPRGSKTSVRSRLKKFFEEAEFLASLAPDAERDPLSEDWEFVRHPMIALLDLAAEFAAEFGRAKRALGGVDFADLEQFALRLVRDPQTGGPTPIALAWRGRLEHLFVDECQDINQAQDAILSALSREGETANRFLVGDAKQSIYRFRLANPAIFRAYEKAWGQGAAHARRISLADNFRSRRPILDFINPFFSALMREDTGGVSYEPLQFGGVGEPGLDDLLSHEPGTAAFQPPTDWTAGKPSFQFMGGEEPKSLTQPSVPEPRVEFHLVARGEDAGDEQEPADESPKAEADLADLQATEREARLVALRLLELHREGHAIWDKAERKFRPVAWRDMVVLLRSPAGRAEAFAKEFHRAGVPLDAARGSFLQSTEISDLLCLLKLIDNPMQDIPLLAVLRSPLGGLSVDELGEIRAHNREPSFWLTVRRFHREWILVDGATSASLSSSSPCEARAGRGLRRGETNQDGSPPPDPILHPMEDGEKLRSSMQPWDDAGTAAHSAWSKIDFFLRHLDSWRELIRQSSLSACLEAALAETHYEELLWAEPRGEALVGNVRRLLALARQFDPYQRQGLFRFLRFIQAQEESSVEMDSASAFTDDAVRLLSIHKCKGLEFPVVALAGMGWRFNFRDLTEDILLDEQYGLCPKVAPPEGEQRYPSLSHWLAERRQRREVLGEEMRLLYVAMTRARDTLILVGSTSSKNDPRWGASGSPLPAIEEVLSARSYLDWLRLWLPHMTRETEWTSDRSGQNDLLRWTIYSESDSRLVLPPGHGERQPAPTPDGFDESEVRRLGQRLAWQYPYEAATLERAKTNVTQLRRRQEEEDGEAQAASFARRNGFAISTTRDDGITAADIGIAHHTFLQHLNLSPEPSVDFLRKEADRLASLKLLTESQRDALDLVAVAAFWMSPHGQSIRCQDSSAVRRELPFTARFSSAALSALGLPAAHGLGADEYAVVQGVVDLAVILPAEIWLIDFKTDDLDEAEEAARAAKYQPQLKLYAQALAQIYRRPVTKRWLHFLKLRRTVEIES